MVALHYQLFSLFSYFFSLALQCQNAEVHNDVHKHMGNGMYAASWQSGHQREGGERVCVCALNNICNFSIQIIIVVRFIPLLSPFYCTEIHLFFANNSGIQIHIYTVFYSALETRIVWLQVCVCVRQWPCICGHVYGSGKKSTRWLRQWLLQHLTFSYGMKFSLLISSFIQ